MRKKSKGKKTNIKPKNRLGFRPKNKKNKMMPKQKYRDNKRRLNKNKIKFTTKIKK